MHSSCPYCNSIKIDSKEILKDETKRIIQVEYGCGEILHISKNGNVYSGKFTKKCKLAPRG